MNFKKKTTDKSPKYQAPAVQKAFQILSTVAESHKGLSLSEIAHKLRFSKSSTHGLIQALLKIKALDQSPYEKKLFLGPAIVELAFKSWNYFRVREHAQPILDELRDQIGQTVFLGVLSRSRGVIMATAEAVKPLKISSPPGTSIPLLAGAVGKIFLSQFDNQEVLKLLRENGLPRFTPKSILNEEEYLSELKKVRKNQYALDNEEYLSGVKAVAIGLGNHRGLPLALWVVGFAASMSDDKIPDIIRNTRKTAGELRIILGKSP